MGPLFYVLPCPNPKCQMQNWLPYEALQQIVQNRARGASHEKFVNFVCPHCGLGIAYRLQDLQPRPSVSFPTLVREPLYCATLRCGEKGCELKVLAHTKAKTGKQDSEPRFPVQDWKSAGLECPNGHHATEPPELLGHSVLALDAA